MAPNAPQVNHLLFVDDSLLFFNATLDMARRVESSLQRYCASFGHRINREKSSVFFIKGCSESVRQEIKHALDAQNEKLS